MAKIREKTISLLATWFLISTLIMGAMRLPIEGTAASQTLGDVVIIDDAHKLAYFGVYTAAELDTPMVYMNETGWDLFNRTLMWATSYEPPNGTRIMLFTPDGTANQTVPNPADGDAAVLYNWLLMAGYETMNITVYPDESVMTLGPVAYTWADVVIYWSTEGYYAYDIVLSGVPFITIACSQTDEMNIATGSSTLHEARQDFNVVNNFYDPTQDYPKGPFSFNSSVWCNATEVTVDGDVLIAADVVSEAPPVIGTDMHQAIQVLPDGNAEMSFALVVSDTPLADMYRDMFFETLPPYEPDQSYPIPETRNVSELFEPEAGVEHVLRDAPMEGDVNKDLVVDIFDVISIASIFGLSIEHDSWDPDCDLVSDHVIDIFDIIVVASHFGDDFDELRPSLETEDPVREQLYEGIMIEQAALLGFLVDIYDSTITPWNSANETVLSLSATSPQFAERQANPTDWKIYIGHAEETNATLRAELKANFTLTKIQYIQQMLQMWSGDQNYQLHYSMDIQLSPGAMIYNYADLNGMNWHIDLGGGSVLDAIVIATPSSLLVDETMIVTEQEITVDEQDLLDAFDQYKTFTADCSWVGYGLQAQSFDRTESVGIEGTVEKKFSYTVYPGSWQYTWTWGSTSATLKITPSLTLEWYIGWRHKWYGWSYKLKWFNTYFKVTPQIEAQATVSATAVYDKTWSRVFGSWSKRFSFWLGPVPVWANLQLKVTGKLTLTASAGLSFDITVTAKSWFKAGVRWDRGEGWSSYYEYGYGASKSGPTITGVAKVTLTPSVSARLTFLLYDVAGPFIEGTPYAPITVQAVPSRTWSVELRFKISAGVAFAGWLKKAVGLSDYSRDLKDWQLIYWSGTW